MDVDTAKVKTEKFDHDVLTKDNFKEVILSVAEKELKMHHHAWGYLNFHYGEHSEEFARQLVEHFPPLPLTYVNSLATAPDYPEVFPVQLKDLSWKERASTKPPPFFTTVMQILDEILTNTFKTATNAISVWDNADTSLSGNPVQWISYVKGAARSAAVLTLASLAIRYEWDIGFLYPALQKSMCVVHCQKADCASDLAAVALCNLTFLML